MANNDYLILQFPSRSQNESLARAVIGVFAARLDPTLQELAELKTAVSEAVTNSIIHGYPEKSGLITVKATILSGGIEVVIEDRGVGIEDIEQAMCPLYTSRPDLERSGLGFTVMQEFADSIDVSSIPGRGTTVTLVKFLGKAKGRSSADGK